MGTGRRQARLIIFFLHFHTVLPALLVTRHLRLARHLMRNRPIVLELLSHLLQVAAQSMILRVVLPVDGGLLGLRDEGRGVRPLSYRVFVVLIEQIPR